MIAGSVNVFLKGLLLVLFQFLLVCNALFSQSIPYGKILGKSYSVGFADTILLDPNTSYTYGSYSGPLPLFVSIWHPIKRINNADVLSFENFSTWKKNEEMKKILHDLNKNIDSAFIENCLTELYMTDGQVNYAGLNSFSFLDSLKKIKTTSREAPFRSFGKFPVLFYHHGTLSSSSENFLLAEYFATRGFVVISASFHLPSEKQKFGFNEVLSNTYRSERRLSEFARSLAGKNKIVYIGHSWGAQTGWCLMHEPGFADAFVSLETTIEFKSDSLQIADMWPFVYESLKLKRNKLKVPVLQIANTMENQNFSFFSGHVNADHYCVSAKEEFGHESYTSIFFLRYFFHTKYPQKDVLLMKKQFELYLKHLRLIEEFVRSITDLKPMKMGKLNEVFYIN